MSEGNDKKFGQPITDHNPPAELNNYRKGGFYGHSYCEQKMVSFLEGGTEILGRPADCLETPDGSIPISDDTGNRIDLLSYVGK